MEVCKLVAEVFVFFSLPLLSFVTCLLAGKTCSFLAAERPKVKLQCLSWPGLGSKTQDLEKYSIRNECCSNFLWQNRANFFCQAYRRTQYNLIINAFRHQSFDIYIYFNQFFEMATVY